MLEPPAPSKNGYANGSHPAPPPASGGAVSSRAKDDTPTVKKAETIFPPDLTQLHWRSALYWLGWAQLGGQSLLRWLWYAGLALTLAMLLLPLPAKPWLVGALLLLLLVLSIARQIVARTQFVKFVADDQAISPLAPIPLPANAKIAVQTTGTLSVSGKERFFLALPGFYRTFPTREHALMCMCRDRSVLWLGSPPEMDLGLWYAFWQGAQIVEMQRGMIAAAHTAAPGIRLFYTSQPKKRRFGGSSTTLESLHIACESHEDRDRIWQDLLHDAAQLTTSRSSGTQPISTTQPQQAAQ